MNEAALGMLDVVIDGRLSGLGPAGVDLGRLTMAALLGAVAGLEREVRGRSAGFRTYTLVALGSCLVMIVSMAMASLKLPRADPAMLQIDPSRIAYGVMTGIGFLGAGTIIQHRSSVHGLTTAAGIWCVAAIGLAVGAGLYSVAIGATVLVLLVLWLLDYIERLLPQQRHRIISFVIHNGPELGVDPAAMFRPILRRAGVKLTDATAERDTEKGHWTISLRLGYRSAEQITRVLGEILRDRPDAVLTASKDA